MRFVSTRGGVAPTAIGPAIAAGLAPDGGLFVPERLPPSIATGSADTDRLAEVAATLLAPFFAGDADLAVALPAICRDALTFDAPHRELVPDTGLLELFHGPTAAFKDFGARFLAACLARLEPPAGGERTILVATSGDTGGAVADAFFARPGFRVVVLYPDGRVSPRQAHLLGCYGDNVRAFRIAGTFDDCQRLVKACFADRELTDRLGATSANSISLGRLLPQMTYYASSAVAFFRARGTRLNYVVPTGNLGNALACLWARRLGLPIGEIVLATNGNRVLPDFFAGADYAPRASIATLANAMDVGDPSNFERLRWFWPDADELRRRVTAQGVDDATIARRITDWHARYGLAICPHTAAAAEVRERLRDGGDDRPWCVVATAHAAKFDTVVEHCVGGPVAVPASLARLLARPATAEPLAADFGALRSALLG